MIKFFCFCYQPSYQSTSTKKLTRSLERENSKDSKDRLSELPDEVLIHILSFLPTACAVRTMLLRRFGNLWTLVPALEFENDSLKFVRDVMNYHKSSTIDRLQMCTGWVEHKHKKEMLKWVRTALRKNPKVCYFDSCQYCIISVLPRVFTSQSIMTLRLSDCDSLPRVIDMRSLRSLYLFCVDMADEDLKALEIGCPCLQELYFDNPGTLQKVHFTAPNIERLRISDIVEKAYSLDCPNLKFLGLDIDSTELEVIDVSSVHHANIFGEFDNDEYLFETIHKKFRNAKFVNFQDLYRCEQMEQCGNQKLEIKQNSWSHLALYSRLQGSCLLSICRLLRKSSRLKELILYADMDIICNCDMLMQELSSPCKMEYLKTVTIHEFEKPCKTLVQLVEFLLKNAVVLDKLIIVCNKKDQFISRDGFEFVSELLSLPRASENASVVLA